VDYRVKKWEYSTGVQETKAKLKGVVERVPSFEAAASLLPPMTSMSHPFSYSPYVGKALLLALLNVAVVFPQSGSQDPVFATVPFDRWLAEREHALIPWKTSVFTSGLSSHQRLLTTVIIYVDGRQLGKRPQQGQLLMLLQFNDSQGRVYRGHGTFELKELDGAASQVDVFYTFRAFVAPGEYRIAIGLFHTETQESSFTRRLLRVAPLKNDPLPEAWRDLPPVEVLSPDGPPDEWFRPSVIGRLHLPLETRRPVHIDLLMNLPPELASGWYYQASMGVLLPALKVISQVEVRNGSLDVALLDLARRCVVFEQANERDLDWPQLKSALTGSNRNVIDVHALENCSQNAEFFLSQIRGRLDTAISGQRQRAAEPLRALIVLSAPMELARGTDLHPVQPDDFRGWSVYYIRYHSLLAASLLERLFAPMSPARPVPRVGGRPMPPARGLPAEPIDSLENLLKPLHPRLFDVANPEQFRKALARLLAEISGL